MPFQDEHADLRREPDESEGQLVFRHLQAIVAWHAAATGLLQKKLRLVAKTLRVGLVEVTQSNSNLMTDDEVIQEFFRRRPAASPEARTCIENIIRENHRKTFTGATHAEATLMGLLTYFSLAHLPSIMVSRSRRPVFAFSRSSLAGYVDLSSPLSHI